MPDNNAHNDAEEQPILGELVGEEPKPPHPGFWWAVLWCVGILLVTQLLPGIVGVVIFVVDSPTNLKPESLSGQALLRSPAYARAMMWAMPLAQFLSIASAWLAIRLVVGREWPRILALRWPSWSHLILALIGLPGVIVISIGVDGLAKRYLPSFVNLEDMMSIFGQWPWPLGVLVIGLGPGIGEELWFRGFFGRGLVGRHGFVVGILLTSLLFGLIHMEPRQVASALSIGVLLHLSYLASRSLLVPVLLHTANNSLSILAMHDPVLRAIDVPPEVVPWYAYGAAFLLIAAVGWAFFKSRSLLVDVPGSSAYSWWPAFPGVECPPLGTATRVFYPSAGWAGWILVIVSVVLFAGSLIPAVDHVCEVAHQERERKRKGPAVPSALQVAELLRKQPISAATWPLWSRRLRDWLGDTTNNTDAAYEAAREFLDRDVRSGGLRPPLLQDAMAWYIHGRGYIRQMGGDRREAITRGRNAETALRRSIALEPTIGRAHYGLAVALFLQSEPVAGDDRRLAEARTEAAEAERLDPTVSAKSAEAWAAMLQQRFAFAEQLYRDAFQDRSDEVTRARALAQAIIVNAKRAGSYAAALESLVQHFPDDAALRCCYAVALSRDGRPRSAARELDLVRQQGVDPAKHVPGVWVGRIHSERNRPEPKVGSQVKD